SASDTVNLTGATGAITVNLADSTVPTNTTVDGYGATVTLTGVEVVNLNAGSDSGNAALTIFGTANNDSLSYTPTGASAGRVADAGLNTAINFTNVSPFPLDPLGGTNSVTVNGDANSNAITAAASGANTTVQVDALQTVTLVTADTQALAIAGQQG